MRALMSMAPVPRVCITESIYSETAWNRGTHSSPVQIIHLGPRRITAVGHPSKRRWHVVNGGIGVSLPFTFQARYDLTWRRVIGYASIKFSTGLPIRSIERVMAPLAERWEAIN
jgi:hypothetical protein